MGTYRGRKWENSLDLIRRPVIIFGQVFQREIKIIGHRASSVKDTGEGLNRE